MQLSKLLMVYTSLQLSEQLKLRMLRTSFATFKHILIISDVQERWHNGRAIFASLTSSVRVLNTTLYLSLLPPKEGAPDATKQTEAVQDLLSLIVAYCYAFK